MVFVSHVNHSDWAPGVKHSSAVEESPSAAIDNWKLSLVSLRDKGNVSLYLSELRLLVRKQTSQHKFAIFSHPQLGRVLILDDEIQHVEAWAPLYHEPLIHVPAAYIPAVRSALILGGGSLFAAREVLKYSTIDRVLLIDHDKELIDTICEVYEHGGEVTNDVRLEIFVHDAFSALPKIKEKFDLVVNDSVDLFRSAGAGTFDRMASLLTTHGICSDLIYRHLFDDVCMNKTIRMLRGKYHMALSLVAAPEYPGVLHLLTMWGSSRGLTQGLRKTKNHQQQKWVETSSANPCVYFDSRFLAYYLHLPRYIRARIDDRPTT
jgi:spermidine synthase